MATPKEAPNPTVVPKKKKPNPPVTNPAFRDNADLRELQRQLHRNNRKK